MEAILALASPEKARDFVLPLSLGGVRVRMVVQTGNQLIAELNRESIDVIILPEALPDGPAEMWLGKVAALLPRRPVAVVLIYGVESSEAVRDRVRAVYGPAADVVAAGARSIPDAAGETAKVAERLSEALTEQDRDAFERISKPIPTAPIPQPVKRSGAIACVGASGGVGTSTLIANLAAFAAISGQRVLLMDAAFASAGALAHHLSLQPDETNRGMHQLRWSYGKESVVDEVIEQSEQVHLRKTSHGEIRLLGAPAVLEVLTGLPTEHITWAMQVLERRFDLLMVDCGSGLTDPRTQQILSAADRIFLLAGGWGASIHALGRTLGAMDGRPELECIYLLLREAPETKYGARHVRSVANRPIFGRIPEDPLVRKADLQLGARTLPVLEEPVAPYAAAVTQLAYSLGLVGQAEPKPKRSWFRFGRKGA